MSNNVRGNSEQVAGLRDILRWMNSRSNQRGWRGMVFKLLKAVGLFLVLRYLPISTRRKRVLRRKLMSGRPIRVTDLLF
jgi:hypothetical protein